MTKSDKALVILVRIVGVPAWASLLRVPPVFVHHQPQWKKGFGRGGMDASSKKNFRRKRERRGRL
jgi:hypothetical protein